MEKKSLFSKDKSVVILLLVNTLVAVLSVLTVALRLRSHDFKVPVQYIVHDGSVVASTRGELTVDGLFFP